MTQEEKQLLLKDLCGRLPYGVVCMVKTSGWERDFTLEPLNVTYLFNVGRGMWLDCKPYLRPVESMTEEEVEEYMDLIVPVDAGKAVIEEEKFTKVEDFYNRHLLDYRGLIKKGLALEAKEGMYNK